MKINKIELLYSIHDFIKELNDWIYYEVISNDKYDLNEYNSKIVYFMNELNKLIK